MSNLIFGNALSGLKTSTVNLNTVSNNIANANKPGYNRQSAIQVNARSLQTAVGYQGAGVDVSTIGRAYSGFLTNQLRQATSQEAYFAAGVDVLGKVDRLLSDDNAGVSSALSKFFEAAQDLTGNPSDVPIRQNMIAASEELARRFNSLELALQEVVSGNNRAIDDSVTVINDYARQIAGLNQALSSRASNVANGAPDNALLDQRDQLIAELAKQIEVKVLEQADGSLSVFMGSGLSLVNGNEFAQLSTSFDPANPSMKRVALDGVQDGQGKSVQLPARYLGSGALPGYLKLAEGDLNQAQGQLNLLAIQVHNEFNAVQVGGVDLKGQSGKPLFSFNNVPTAIATGSPLNASPASTLNLGAIQYGRLGQTDFEVLVGQGGAITIYPTGRLDQAAQLTPDGNGQYTVNGGQFRFTLSGGPVAGDRFHVRLAVNAASALRSNLQAPQDIAAGFSVGASGDNRNLLKMVALQNQKLLNLDQGGATLTEGFTQLITSVANETRQSQTAVDARKAILTQAQADIEALGGVNLDEEASNLLRYQQAYQANAQVIGIARELFGELIASLR